MKLGACVWPFQWEPPYEAAIRRIASLGFRAVELIAWDRQTLDEYYAPQRVQALRRLLADEGLELSEFVSTPPGMASRDPDVRAHTIDHFQRLGETADPAGWSHRGERLTPQRWRRTSSCADRRIRNQACGIISQFGRGYSYLSWPAPPQQGRAPTEAAEASLAARPTLRLPATRSVARPLRRCGPPRPKCLPARARADQPPASGHRKTARRRSHCSGLPRAASAPLL